MMTIDMGPVAGDRDESTGKTYRAEIEPGLRLGRYQLLLAVAAGGMGRVWAGRLVGHKGFRRFVAIKTVLPEHAAKPEFERMFLDEARIAAAVQHPNVCSIYDLAEDNGVLYLAMEWVNGEALSTLLERAADDPPDRRLVARIVAHASAGLHSAHELRDDAGELLGVIHRDVSPHNLLVSLDGHVKVADFGIAKARGQIHKATATGEFKGKLAYMAPEQLVGDPVDRRVDVFALGCVLYEATVGKPPFSGDALAVMYQIVEAEVEPPSAVAEGYPADLEAIVLKALAKEPSARYATAEELRVDIEGWLAKTGPVVTEQHVSAWVRSLAGASLDERSSRIRAAAEDVESRLSSGVEVASPALVSVPDKVTVIGPREMASVGTPVLVGASASTTEAAFSSSIARRNTGRATLMLVGVAASLVASIVSFGLVQLRTASVNPASAEALTVPTSATAAQALALPPALAHAPASAESSASAATSAIVLTYPPASPGLPPSRRAPPELTTSPRSSGPATARAAASGAAPTSAQSAAPDLPPAPTAPAATPPPRRLKPIDTKNPFD